jgi:hypothetical protein
MKAFLVTLSIALIALGMWMIAGSFFLKDETRKAGAVPAPQTIRATGQPDAAPAVLGFALTAGGVLLLVVTARRRA